MPIPDYKPPTSAEERDHQRRAGSGLASMLSIVAAAHAADPVIIWQNSFESADTCAWSARIPVVVCDPDMVFVPSSVFTMGSNTHYSNDQPEHIVTTSAFWISRTEVDVGLKACR